MYIKHEQIQYAFVISDALNRLIFFFFVESRGDSSAFVFEAFH